MTFKGYEVETLASDDDCGVMPDQIDQMKEAVVGHKIVSAGWAEVPHRWYSDRTEKGFVITLDNGKKVMLQDTDDCCAYTELENFLLNVENIDHIITGVGTTNGYDTWHIYCDLGDVLELQVGWSCGNPFYYGYGFVITVQDIDE
jgi:hypothetical protein